MQEVFSQHEQRVKAFRSALSEPRFSRYLKAANGLEIDAIYLYHWNCGLAQALYFSLHMWEVTLRNKINTFLCGRYGPNWPYERGTLFRNLTDADQKRLTNTIDKQERERGTSPVHTNIVVADLSAGFWVSQLSRAYDVPHVWRRNLDGIFPNEPRMSRLTAHNVCADLLDIRNRVAHHEPIFQSPLDEIRDSLDRIISAMCETSHLYVSQACTFRAVLDAGPLRA
jgi:hypothetical protein